VNAGIVTVRLSHGENTNMRDTHAQGNATLWLGPHPLTDHSPSHNNSDAHRPPYKFWYLNKTGKLFEQCVPNHCCAARADLSAC
jgi:hypothetical protein